MKAFTAQNWSGKVIHNFKVRWELIYGHLVVLKRENEGVAIQYVSPVVAL